MCVGWHAPRPACRAPSGRTTAVRYRLGWVLHHADLLLQPSSQRLCACRVHVLGDGRQSAVHAGGGSVVSGHALLWLEPIAYEVVQDSVMVWTGLPGGQALLMRDVPRQLQLQGSSSAEAETLARVGERGCMSNDAMGSRMPAAMLFTCQRDAT